VESDRINASQWLDKLSELDLSEIDPCQFALMFDYAYPAIESSILLRAFKGLTSHEKKDCAQEVFVRMWRAKETCRSNFKGWLYRIAINTRNDFVRDKARQRSRHVSLEMADDHAVSQALEANCEPDRAEMFEALYRCVGALPPRQCEIIVMSCFEGLSERRIAESMEMSASTANAIKQAALATLERAMKDLGYNIDDLL